MALALPAYVAGETALDARCAQHVAQCLRCQAEIVRYRRMLRTLHDAADRHRRCRRPRCWPTSSVSRCRRLRAARRCRRGAVVALVAGAPRAGLCHLPALTGGGARTAARGVRDPAPVAVASGGRAHAWRGLGPGPRWPPEAASSSRPPGRLGRRGGAVTAAAAPPASGLDQPAPGRPGRRPRCHEISSVGARAAGRAADRSGCDGCYPPAREGPRSQTTEGSSSIWQSTGLQNRRLGVRVPPALLPDSVEGHAREHEPTTEAAPAAAGPDDRGRHSGPSSAAPSRPSERRPPAPPAAPRRRTSPRQFLHEVNVEMRKVAWPTRAETSTTRPWCS